VLVDDRFLSEVQSGDDEPAASLQRRMRSAVAARTLLI
jgi:hypothetical protein